MPEIEKPLCREFVIGVIAGATWISCALPKGHDGGHRGKGNCLKHGECFGEAGEFPRCPAWPDCIAYDSASEVMAKGGDAPIESDLPQESGSAVNSPTSDTAGVGEADYSRLSDERTETLLRRHLVQAYSPLRSACKRVAEEAVQSYREQGMEHLLENIAKVPESCGSTEGIDEAGLSSAEPPSANASQSSMDAQRIKSECAPKGVASPNDSIPETRDSEYQASPAGTSSDKFRIVKVNMNRFKMYLFGHFIGTAHLREKSIADAINRYIDREVRERLPQTSKAHLPTLEEMFGFLDKSLEELAVDEAAAEKRVLDSIERHLPQPPEGKPNA